MKVRPISAFLREIGIVGHAEQQAARRILEQQGFTRSERQNMAREKEPKAREALQRALAFHCSNDACKRAIAEQADGRTLVQVERHGCEVCEGSVNRASLEEMGQALRDAALSRVLVVGGTTALYTEIRKVGPSGVQWRFVEGTKKIGLKVATGDLAWADVVVIWASTPLAHTVSGMYAEDARAITIPSRGISALAKAVTTYAQRRRAAR
jgi:hypothetical protein